MTSTLGFSAYADEALYEADVPPGYRPVKRRGQVRGLQRAGGGRIDERLASLARAGRLSVSFDDLDMFQRIANVESGGLVQALNTWDSAVVSIGFLQLTLRYGELQKWIRRASRAFDRYGIAVEATRQYRFSDGTVPAILGAARAADLRFGAWADRFYRAGLDDDIIVAEVALGLERNRAHLDRLRTALKPLPGGFELFMVHYSASPYVRAVFQEAYNNRPAYARRGASTAVAESLRLRSVTTAEFTTLLLAGIRAAYAVKEEAAKADRIFRETRQGARPGLLGSSGGARPAPDPVTGAGLRPAGGWNSVVVTPGSIVDAAGIRVHRIIAGQVRQMVATASTAGVVLRGGGYRSPASQIDVRRSHCGPTPYDIYQKPSNQCRPPTARPGHSRHEQGLAIDFNLDKAGRVVAWLRANAARFGFVNLKSEPWHWSVDGR